MALVPEQVWVTANFKGNAAHAHAARQKVTIKIDAYPGRDFRGHVDSIQAGTGERFSLLPPENATGNYVKVVHGFRSRSFSMTPRIPHFLLAPDMSVVPTVKVK